MKMKKHFLFPALFLLAALMAGGLIWYFRSFPSPPQKAADRFLSALSEGRDCIEWLTPDLSKHPFLSLAQESEIRQFSVGHWEGADKKHGNVRITLLFPAGEIHTALPMVKRGQHWLVSGLPETTFHTHGIPIAKKADEKNQTIWALDLGNQIVEIHSRPAMEIKIGQPVSFHTVEGKLIDIQALQPVSLSRVMSLSDTVLEDRDLGYFKIQQDFPVFSREGNQFVFSGSYGIPIGSAGATLYCTPDHIGRMAILSGQPPDAYERIRVLLQDSEYKSPLHSRIEITCPDNYTVQSVPNGKSLSFQKGETAEFKPDGKKTVVCKNGQVLDSSIFRWYITTQQEKPLYVKTIWRSHTDPSAGTLYQGSLEVANLNGQLTLINEVNLEKYLCLVVPSEMPVKFGLEALKVQAIAARSYAVRAMQSSGYRTYGAHLDDSTASQVYNNIGKEPIATRAVTETSGAVAEYQDNIVDTRFFSTSFGYTANFHEVWSNRQNEFPSEEVPYLTANPQFEGNVPDLYHEENFRAFLSQANLAGFDRYSPFFRWSVTMTREQLEAVLNKSLPDLYRQQPLFVLTKCSDGDYRSMAIPEDVGTLLNIGVLQRGKGGNIMELEITTTYGIFKVIKEYNIRLALQPVNYLRGKKPVELQCHDGTVQKDFPLLPSAFACFDFERDKEGNLLDIVIRGGGYGHGVGMSQYGTYGLTLMGKDWQEIIEHYYPGSQLRNIYKKETKGMDANK
ncbi:SpoIID/LytB domain-containing protein [Eubacteriales bacterium mix99]|jgi:peptidoglycan hydrolase-like amidase/co-chaperonin GroES (HSP10)